MPGPPPTPTAILAARGSWRAKARSKIGEPSPRVGIPDCPAWLSDPAKEVWSELVPMLVGLRVLATVDANALARYCDAFVLWQRAAEGVDSCDCSPMGSRGKGKLTACPYNALYVRYDRILATLEDRFGLSPTARTKLHIG